MLSKNEDIKQNREKEMRNSKIGHQRTLIFIDIEI